MAKLLVVGFGPDAEPWEAGKIVSGFLVSVNVIPNCESRKVTLDCTGKGQMVACWETASLKQYLALMEVGKFYRITCLGKKKWKNGTGWEFSVEELADNEITAWITSSAVNGVNKS